MGTSDQDRLHEYRLKRKASGTPEPFGGGAARPRLFVVQKHAATSLHYDFRLEWNGVLLSWAVPKGPSADPDVKRLAMQTEDHPVEYADFEGTIPEGNYGAGRVIVWDQGSWVPLEDPEEGLQKGKLLFELKGHKLRGVWTIFRTKKKDEPESRQWLMVKKPDAYAEEGEPTWSEASVFSGLTLDEMRDGSERAALVRSELEELGAPKGNVDASKFKVMLAKTEERIFSSPDWIYELKYDGFRLLCARQDGEARLYYRSGREATRLYPELVRTVRALPYSSVILDTEIVVLDERGIPEFQLLQKRAQLSREPEIERGAIELPVVAYAFDLPAFEDYDLRKLPLTERKRLLALALPPAGTLRYCDHIEEQGEAFYAQVREMGLEGVMAKKADSAYRGARSESWLKLKADRSGDFVIVGWTAPKGSRAGLGALHIGAYEGGELTYAGRVGTGFTDKQLEELRETLDPLQVDEPPCTGPVPKTRGHFWVRAELVCEVKYKERTADGLLRHPSFQRLRDDKKPEECHAPEARGAERTLPVEAPEPASAEPGTERRFTPSNLTKVFWPKAGYTKGDLIDFYREIAPWILPYLRDRPVVLTRYPDGIEGKSFFQKDAPSWVPGWLRRERIWSDQTEREIDYFIADEAEALAFLANLGTIPLHVWSSRVTDLARPDWCILDLDPKGAPFTDVVCIAKAIHKLCDKVQFDAYIKTSGSTGLHILLPLAGQCTYEQSRTLGELIARIIAAELPEIATTVRNPRKREGKVYVDYVQNGHGSLLVAPFSVRPLPGAPVSTPLRWSEVNDKLTIEQFDIRTVLTRVKRMKDEPMLPLLSGRPDLVGILARLAECVDEE